MRGLRGLDGRVAAEHTHLCPQAALGLAHSAGRNVGHRRRSASLSVVRRLANVVRRVPAD